MKKAKLVYRDDKSVKVLWGIVKEEDSIFVTFITDDGNNFRINKNQIISIKEVA